MATYAAQAAADGPYMNTWISYPTTYQGLDPIRALASQMGYMNGNNIDIGRLQGVLQNYINPNSDIWNAGYDRIKDAYNTAWAGSGMGPVPDMEKIGAIDPYSYYQEKLPTSMDAYFQQHGGVDANVTNIAQQVANGVPGLEQFKHNQVVNALGSSGAVGRGAGARASGGTGDWADARAELAAMKDVVAPIYGQTAGHLMTAAGNVVGKNADYNATASQWAATQEQQRQQAWADWTNKARLQKMQEDYAMKLAQSQAMAAMVAQQYGGLGNLFNLFGRMVATPDVVQANPKAPQVGTNFAGSPNGSLMGGLPPENKPPTPETPGNPGTNKTTNKSTTPTTPQPTEQKTAWSGWSTDIPALLTY